MLLVEVLQGVQKILQNYEAAQHTLQMERELQNSRISIMLSQIKPHFLYNALTVIQALCSIDPAAAENAVSEFSDYLRGNMSALTEEKLIPFLKELEHTKHYLTLEQLRFGDQLQVEYDLGPTGFQLPALSLQPLVENAIRHGVRAKTDDAIIRPMAYSATAMALCAGQWITLTPCSCAAFRSIFSTPPPDRAHTKKQTAGSRQEARTSPPRSCGAS